MIFKNTCLLFPENLLTVYAFFSFRKLPREHDVQLRIVGRWQVPFGRAAGDQKELYPSSGRRHGSIHRQRRRQRLPRSSKGHVHRRITR